MKTIRNIILVVLPLFSLLSCEQLDGRDAFPHSTPVIESASIDPSTFVYGDSVTLNLKASDPLTPLSTVEVKLVVNDKMVGSGVFRTKGNNSQISPRIATKFLSQLPDNAQVDILLTLINVENDKTTGTISNVIGKRKVVNKLYLVLESGVKHELASTGDNKYTSAEGLSLPNSIKYLIAEKMTAENKIDFSGMVWGSSGQEIVLAGTGAKFITSSEPRKKNTDQVVFDAYEFTTQLIGEDLQETDNLDIAMFSADVLGQNSEAFKEGSFLFTKDQELTLNGELADAEIVFNVDYFERLSVSTVKYLGETGPMTLDYNQTRKMVLIKDPNPNYPTSLFITGSGMGYPSKVLNEATISWGFDNVTQFISFRKIADKVYQGTVYLEGNPDSEANKGANFKPFLQRGWGEEIKSSEYTINDFLSTDLALGKTDGNWYVKLGSETGVYRITINLGSKAVSVEPFTLP